jgi:PAS domain S-box-containing protein
LGLGVAAKNLMKANPYRQGSATIRNHQIKFLGAKMADEISSTQLEELKRSEFELADFFEKAPIPFHWVGPDGIILRANQAELETFGYTRAEYVGHHIAEFHVDQDAIQNMLERLRRGETLHDYQCQVRGKDGSIRHVLINSSAMLENGKFVHTRCSTRDISPRKRSERRMAMVHAVTRLLAEARTLAEVSSKILQAICDYLEWEFGAFWQADDAFQTLHCVEVWHATKKDLSAFEATCREINFSRGVGLPGRVWQTCDAIWIADITKEANFPRASAAASAGLHGTFAFPITLADNLFGVMEFFSSEIRQPDKALLRTVETMGSEIGQFVERLRAEIELQQKNNELQATIEEFEVIQEELKAQNEELFQTRMAVENERKRYQDLFEFAPDGYLVTDLQGTILEVNEAAAKQLHTPVMLLVGTPLLSFVDPEWRPSIDAELIGVPAAGTIKRWNVRLVPADSSHFDAALTVGAVRDAQQNPVALRWLIHDVTEHKRAEDALRRSEERLREQSQELEQQLIASGRLVSLGEITASMAHEFNNPLGIIMGFVEDILSTMDPADPNYRSLKIIDEESKRCKKIISDLMEYARPRSMDLCLTDVTAVIDKTLQLVENRLYKQKVTLEKNLSAALPRINADPQQLEQVLVNLYLNAIDAMPNGGKLIVEASENSTAGNESSVIVSVRDTGFGIEEKHRPRIFLPFFTAKKRTGLGLGLPICERIVKNHGGRIEVESQPGNGTTFKIYLSASHASAGAPPAVGEAKPAGAGYPDKLENS